ncbi:uncharacterized protein LOC130266843 [Oenanthe melanoleuca]|uniref:uncharacterized protein LOC130266843 n=1 Tax=Oenanthe melanoleuca TaxID=2939378 RepID=UPI0024C1E791|nr:uncharacterized protein LOC130266843 [Oenanthe melanoleuca]
MARPLSARGRRAAPREAPPPPSCLREAGGQPPLHEGDSGEIAGSEGAWLGDTGFSAGAIQRDAFPKRSSVCFGEGQKPGSPSRLWLLLREWESLAVSRRWRESNPRPRDSAARPLRTAPPAGRGGHSARCPRCRTNPSLVNFVGLERLGMDTRIMSFSGRVLPYTVCSHLSRVREVPPPRHGHTRTLTHAPLGYRQVDAAVRSS